MKLKTRTLFWNVDTQRDFINKDGALYVEGAESIISNLHTLTNIACHHNIRVVSTMDYHSQEDSELSKTPDFINTFPKHCMIGSEGSEFIKATNPKIDYRIIYKNYESIMFTLMPRNIIIQKDKFDVFEGNKNTDKVLEALKPTLICVYGVSGDYCVNYAIKGLVKRGYKVIAVIDAIQSLKETPIKEWCELGVDIVSTANLCNQLRCSL